MPITDIRSYVTTGNDFEAHWTEVNDDRAANTLPELAFPDGYKLADLAADIVQADAAITLDEDLNNAFDLVAQARDTLKNSLRDRLMEFRKAVDYRAPESGYVRALPDTPHEDASEQKTLKAADDMESLWTRLNADAAVPNFTPPLLLREGYDVAAFTADLATLRANYKSVSEAETGARIARKKRDVLLEPLKDKYVEYRQAIEVEYGEEHPFFQSLPDVYPPKSGGGTPAPPSPPALPSFSFNWFSNGEGGTNVVFQMPSGVAGVTQFYAREGAAEVTANVVLNPGQSQQVQWPGVTISGEIDEVKLRDAEGSDVATGERDPELPDPGP